MSVIAGLAVFFCAGACAVSWCLWMERRDQRAEAAQPRKPIGARYVAAPGFPQPEPTRAEHIEAVRALCCTSEPYVYARLYEYERDLSAMAELLLELDDLSPMPDDGDGTWRSIAE